jgi:hypothetical protein
MKNLIPKKNRLNLGTRFLSSSGLGFGDFWSRTATDDSKIPKDFSFFKWPIFPRGIGNNFYIYRFSSCFFARINISVPDSHPKSP